MNQYHIKLDVFQGPFDLLLHLIHKHQVDIYDIPIARIADEFVEYLQSAEILDVAQAADFLVMAATLMQIKARMLVPRPQVDADDYEDPRSELVERLIEYRNLRDAATVLQDRSEFWSHVFTREIDEVVCDSGEYVPDLGNVSVSALASAFVKVLARADDGDIPDEPTVITRDQCTVAAEVRRLRRRLKYEQSVSFFDLFEPTASRAFVVTTFLAVLELIRQGEVIATQSAPFCDILLLLVEKERGRPREH